MIEKRAALATAIAGIFVMSLILVFAPVKELSNKEKLDNLGSNERLLIKGQVAEERISQYYKTIMLDNSITLQSDKNTPYLKGKKIEALTQVEINGKYTNLNVLKIKY